MPIKREEKKTKNDRGNREIGKETHFNGQYFEQVYLSDGLNVIKNDNNANKTEKQSFLRKFVSLFTKKKESNGNKRNYSVSPTTIRKYIDDGFILPHLQNPYCPINYLPTESAKTNSRPTSKLNENNTKIIISNENTTTCSNEEDRTKYVQTDTKELNPTDSAIRTQVVHFKSTELIATNMEKSNASESDKISNRGHGNERKSMLNKKGNVKVATECLRVKTKIHGIPSNERDNKFLKFGKSKKKIKKQVSYERKKGIEQYKNTDEFIDGNRTSLNNSDITLVSNCNKSKQIIQRECSSNDHTNHSQNMLRNKMLHFNDNIKLDSSIESLADDLYATTLEKDSLNNKKIAGTKIKNIPKYSAYKTEQHENIKSNIGNSSKSNEIKKYTKLKYSREKFYYLNNEDVSNEKYKREANQLTATNSTREIHKSRKSLTDKNPKQISDTEKCVFPLIKGSKKKARCKIKESQLTQMENNSSSIESLKEDLPSKNEYLLTAEERNVSKYKSNNNVINEKREECNKKKQFQVPKSDSEVNNFSSEYYFDEAQNEITTNKRDNSLTSTNTNQLIITKQRVHDSSNSIGGHSSFSICNRSTLDLNNTENPLVEDFSQRSWKSKGKEDNRQPIISHPDLYLNRKQLISTKGMVWPKTTDNNNDRTDLEIYRAGKFGRTFQKCLKTDSNAIQPQTSSFMDHNDESLLTNLHNTPPENMIKPQIQKLRQNLISNVSIYEEPDKYNSCNLLENKIISTFRKDFNIIKSNREETINSSLNISLQQFEDLKNNLCITLCTNDIYNNDHYVRRTISNVSSTDKLPIEYSAIESLTERKTRETNSSNEISRSKWSITESSTLSSKQTSSSNDTEVLVTQCQQPHQNSTAKSRQITSEVNHTSTVVKRINSSIEGNVKEKKKVNCMNNNNKSVSLNKDMRVTNHIKLPSSKVTDNSTHTGKQNNNDNKPPKKVCLQKCVNKNNENITAKVKPVLKKKCSKTAVSTNYSGTTSQRSNLPKKKPKH